MRAFTALLSASWTYAKGQRGRLILYMALFVLANVVTLFEPFAVGRLLNSVQQAASLPNPLQQMTLYFLLLIGLSAGFWIFHGPARVLENGVAFVARRNFKDHLFRIVTALPVKWHKDHHSGRTINQMGKSTNALYEFMSNGWQFIEMIVRLVGSVVALTLLFPMAAGIAVAVSIIALLIVFVFDKYLLASYEAINEKDHFVASALHDYVTNITTVITLRLEQLTRSELWKRMTHYFPLYRTNTVVNEWKWFLATIAISLMTVSVLAWYAYSSILAGSVLLAGTFFMLYDYLQKIGGAFYTFAWKYSSTIQEYADLETASDILLAEHAADTLNLRLPRNWQTIEIQGLQFSYRDDQQKEQHLSNIDLTLTRGKRIALVGESGSGKSTLMALLRGLHTPEAAMVACDGKLLKHGLKHVASSVTLIPQEPEIFGNTIEYNVSVDTELSTKELLEDIELARFTSVLKRLSRGLKTNVAEKGVNLSGGEKQRLALARGIFASKKSDIILLDEPTSSVDSANELAIYRNLFRRFQDRCIVSSIHKLHLLPMFDHIYFIERGRVIEEGSFAVLKQSGGALTRLWNAYTESKERTPPTSQHETAARDLTGTLDLHSPTPASVTTS